MKQLVVVGVTESVIALNKIGTYLRGKNPTIINIDTPEKEVELNGLIRMGLVKIENDGVKEEIIKEAIEESIITVNTNEIKDEVRKRGRPKGTKKIKTASERIDEAEAKTQKTGSRVVVGTGNGNREGKMRYSAIDVDNEVENERTKASIDAKKKLDIEDAIAKEKVIIDESKLDPSEQNGRKATVSTEGKEKSVNMVNNAIPGSKEIKDSDPFIDNKNDDEFDDAFIKL